MVIKISKAEFDTKEVDEKDLINRKATCSRADRKTMATQRKESK